MRCKAGAWDLGSGVGGGCVLLEGGMGRLGLASTPIMEPLSTVISSGNTGGSELELCMGDYVYVCAYWCGVYGCMVCVSELSCPGESEVFVSSGGWALLQASLADLLRDLPSFLHNSTSLWGRPAHRTPAHCLLQEQCYSKRYAIEISVFYPGLAC